LAAQPAQLAPAELPLALLAQQLDAQSFNLLQGEFAPKRPESKVWQQWRLSASLAIATLLVYLLTVGMQGYKASSQAQADLQAANQLYKQRFPQERVVNLRRQVERKLAASGGSSDSSMVGLLAQIQPSLSSMPDMTLDNLRYDVKKSELRFQATAADFAAFEQLKGKLQQQGLQVEQGALSQIEGKVQGTIAIRGKA
jgi:general secretion pathway protein L